MFGRIVELAQTLLGFVLLRALEGFLVLNGGCRES